MCINLIGTVCNVSGTNHRGGGLKKVTRLRRNLKTNVRRERVRTEDHKILLQGLKVC